MLGAVDGAEPLQLRATDPRRHGTEELQCIRPARERHEHWFERTRGAHRRLVAQHAKELLAGQARPQEELWIVVRHWHSVAYSAQIKPGAESGKSRCEALGIWGSAVQARRSLGTSAPDSDP